MAAVYVGAEYKVLVANGAAYEMVFVANAGVYKLFEMRVSDFRTLEKAVSMALDWWETVPSKERIVLWCVEPIAGDEYPMWAGA